MRGPDDSRESQGSSQGKEQALLDEKSVLSVCV